MTPLTATLLYFRLMLYPTLCIGFILLSVFNHFPNERRYSVHWRAWLYRALALMFAVFGLNVMVRIAFGGQAFLDTVDYLIPLPLVFVGIFLGWNLYITGRRI